MKHRITLYFVMLVTVWSSATASNADSALVEHTSLAMLTRRQAMLNPALHGTGFHSSFSQLALGIDMERQSKAFVLEKGTGFTLPYLTASTYHHLNDRMTVWGEASFTTGRQHHVTWNSTSDYDLLQPYILADTLGGDTRRERYAFSGGCAARLDKWSFGGEMNVRAEQEYRGHDPRMRGVVTDVTLSLGTGFQSKFCQLGLALTGNIYKQTNSVAFYREEGVIPEYQMTGLGTVYSRFSGDKRSIYYDGGGLTLRLHASHNGSTGLYGDASLSTHRYHRKLAEYNSMPLTDLYNEQAGTTIGWRKEGSQQRIAVFGHFNYQRRTGNEHIGGTSDARYFPVIAWLTMYKSGHIDTHVGALYGKHFWNLTMKAGYTTLTEEYVFPHRQMDVSHTYLTIVGQCFIRPTKKLLLTVDAQASMYINTHEKMSMPQANMEPMFIQLMQHKHEFSSASYTDLGAGVRADYAWKQSRFGLFAELGGGMTLCSAGEHQTSLHSSIGITF